MSDSMSRSAGRLRSPGEGPRQAGPRTPGDHDAEVPAAQALPRRPGAAPSRAPDRPVGARGRGGAHGLPESRQRTARAERRVRRRAGAHAGAHLGALRRPGRGAGHHRRPAPRDQRPVAGWWLIDVESHERAVELAAYVSSEPGPGGEPLYEWIDVREVMWERPRTTDAA